MTKTSTFEVKFKRRRNQKTNYRKRLSLLLSKKPRLIIRKSNKRILAQVMTFSPQGDKNECMAVSSELKKFGWGNATSNIPSAYLTGYLCGLRAGKKKVSEAVLDTGLHSTVHGGKIFSCLKGFIDAGVKVSADETVFPKEDRIKGKHLSKKESENMFEKTLEAIKKQ